MSPAFDVEGDRGHRQPFEALLGVIEIGHFRQGNVKAPFRSGDDEVGERSLSTLSFYGGADAVLDVGIEHLEVGGPIEFGLADQGEVAPAAELQGEVDGFVSLQGRIALGIPFDLEVAEAAQGGSGRGARQGLTSMLIDRADDARGRVLKKEILAWASTSNPASSRVPVCVG